MPASIRDQVRNYYDRNTNLFLAFQRTRTAENIHRSLWLEGIHSPKQALNASNELIRAEIETLAPRRARIADLGCGVGASLLYILPRLSRPAIAVGLTISPVQARLAQRFAQPTAARTPLHIIEADFTLAPLPTDSLDAAYSIEALVHAETPRHYFREVNRLLRKGGKLILIDDYLADRPRSQLEQQWLSAYIEGWHAPGISTVAQTESAAAPLRLTKNINLTPYLRLRSLPAPLAKTLLFIGKRLPISHPILPSLLGSMALQQSLRAGTIEYRMLVFTKE
jgi:tocopherol O-methyltransferase